MQHSTATARGRHPRCARHNTHATAPGIGNTAIPGVVFRASRISPLRSRGRLPFNLVLWSWRKRQCYTGAIPEQAWSGGRAWPSYRPAPSPCSLPTAHEQTATLSPTRTGSPYLSLPALHELAAVVFYAPARALRRRAGCGTSACTRCRH